MPMRHGRATDRRSFTRAHATSLIWIGWTAIAGTVVGTVVFGIASGFSAIGNAFTAIGIQGEISTLLAAFLILGAGIAVGIGVGTPLIVAGEIVLIGLDQRRLLAKQGRTLRKLRRDLAPRSQPRPVTDRGPERLLNRLTPR
jgi:hypothetical protein